MGDAVIEQTEAPAVAAPAVAAAPTPPAEQKAPAVAAPAEHKAEAAAPAAHGKVAETPAADWRETSIRTLLGEPKDDEPADTRKLREKLTKLASRFTDVGQLLKATHEARVFIGENRVVKTDPLPKNATDDQVKAWRAENGIPETPDKYDLKLPDGFVWADHNEPLVNAYLQTMHAQNARPEEVQRSIAAYAKVQEMEAQRIGQQDHDDKAAAIATLAREWAPGEYEANIAGIEAMFAQFDSGAAKRLIDSRGPGQHRLTNDPAIVRALAQLARAQGFVGASVPPAGAGAPQDPQVEINSIRASMYKDDGTRNPDYWGNPKKAQRLSELLQLKARTAK